VQIPDSYETSPGYPDVRGRSGKRRRGFSPAFRDQDHAPSAWPPPSTRTEASPSEIAINVQRTLFESSQRQREVHARA